LAIYINNIAFFCNSLEPTRFAIPIGIYKVILSLSPKFRRILPELLSVVGRTAIRIHTGNSYKDSQGCILVGINDKAGWLSNSAKYEEKIVALIGQYQKCWISIT
jgi:hypothetical protein